MLKQQPDGDISIAINETFAKKFLDNVNFPWCIDYCFTRSDSSSHHDASSRFASSPHNRDEDCDDDLVLDDVIIEPIRSNLSSPSEPANTERRDQFENPQKQRKFKIEFYRIAVEIPQKPLLNFGNPIIFEDVTVRLKAELKASVTIYGKEYATDQTTPWITLCGRSAKMNLIANECKINGELRVDQIDLKVTLKIWHWEYDCRFDITQLLNKQLKKHGAIEIFDLAGLKTPGIPNSEPLTITNIDLSESRDQLIIKLNVEGNTRES